MITVLGGKEVATSELMTIARQLAPLNFIKGDLRGDMENYKEYKTIQAKNLKKFKELAKKLAEASVPLWNQGDGIGGCVRQYLDEAFIEAGLQITESPSGFTQKQKISNSLRTKVFERDAYRCVYCGTHLELCADHRHPESLGGKTELDNLQTLCRPCNTKKGAKLETINYG